MRNHLISIGIGVGMVVVGTLLWLATRGIHTPIVSLSKVGVAIAVLGGIEMLISGVAHALPSTRHRKYGL